MVAAAFQNLPRGIAEKYGNDPPPSRFTHSLQFTQTNFQFGQSPRCDNTTYRTDYWRDAHLAKAAQMCTDQSSQVMQPNCLLQTSPAGHSMLSNKELSDPHIRKNISPHVKFEKSDQTVLSESIRPLSTRSGSSDHDELFSAELQKEKRKVLQKTNFSFGNDPAVHRTAYREFATQKPHGPRAPACPPPAGAEILPALWQSMPRRSMVHDDFAYIGRNTSQNIYSSRYNSFMGVKMLHTTDAVGQALFNRKRHMLSRSQLDYRRPAVQLYGGVAKQLLVQNISPAVRQDSIWASVNNGGPACICSEHHVNYTWPLAENGTKRFCRGQCNKVR